MRAAAVIALAVLAAQAAQAAPAKRTLTIYAVASTVQFMNHADDRLRGMSVNPFNVSKTSQRVVITKTKEQGNGPFPGDDVLYSFKLYTSPAQARSAGTAIFTCYYDALKHALCDSYFELRDGVLLASGPVPFGSKTFTLSVSGGTRGFIGVGGQVKAVPAAKNAQRLDLVLTQ
jgi:hypothetical protein